MLLDAFDGTDIGHLSRAGAPLRLLRLSPESHITHLRLLESCPQGKGSKVFSDEALASSQGQGPQADV